MFKDKTIIVTGGAQGLGKAIVEGIVRQGGRCLVIDVNEEAAGAMKEELSGFPIDFYQANLLEPDETRAVMARIVAENGKIDGLVNNAGISTAASFESLTQEEWDRIIALNLTSAFVTCHCLYSHMIEWGGGSIVNISSVTGKKGGGFRGTTAYAASKAGVNGLTKGIAQEGAKHNIRCNAVCPGVIKTPMHNSTSKEVYEEICRKIPMGRFAEPAEVANMVLFFLSDQASYITGEIGDVDGGFTMDG
jgi:3-oxoacyl-[acyl-carrier protein] reductase